MTPIINIIQYIQADTNYLTILNTIEQITYNMI